jgi:hypothetical protein
MTETELRFRKVQETVEPRRSTREARVPVLHIQGKWLEKAGFAPGTTAVLTISENKIVITIRKELT